MTDVYLRHKSLKNRYLKYNEWSGPIHEVDTLPEKVRAKACYTPFSGGFLGVIGTSKGPYFFINKDRFDFLDSNWKLSVERGYGKNVVTIYLNNDLILKEEYYQPELDPLDPWSDVESEDFFIWLESKRKDEEFIEMWSIG